MERRLKVILLGSAVSFIRDLPEKVRAKIVYNYNKVECGVRDKELFKKLEGTEIWEFRTLYEGNCYRMFAFWDTEKETLVVATHGIVKKSQETPKKEILRAEAIRTAYFNDKKKY